MHDFFVDRLVYTRDIWRLLLLTRKKARAGGGSLHDVKQEDMSGGNAVNMAHALGVLGVKVLLITHSDAVSNGLLQKTFRGLGVDVRTKPLPPGLTVAFEESVNVMVSHSGGAGQFPPRLLTYSDWASLRRCGLVCSTNWATNEYGTELLVALRRNLGDRATIYLATADVGDRAERYAKLVALMRRRRLVDWLSVNEYEARSTVEALGLSSGDPGRMCNTISNELGIRVDVHTEYVSYTSSAGVVAAQRTNHVTPKRLTGAGDVWDAASVYAFLKGMPDQERLSFANAAARLYLLSDKVGPPSLRQVTRSLG